jgi:hypothetical protein
VIQSFFCVIHRDPVPDGGRRRGLLVSVCIASSGASPSQDVNRITLCHLGVPPNFNDFIEFIWHLQQLLFRDVQPTFLSFFTVQVMDATGDTATKDFSIKVTIPNCVDCHNDP